MRRSESTAAALFGLLWENMADLLGNAATATLIRRAVGRGVSQRPELAELAISRDRLLYQFRVPDTWQQARNVEPLEALREMVRQLYPLLVELTGQVVVRRLMDLTPLVQHEILPRLEE